MFIIKFHNEVDVPDTIKLKSCPFCGTAAVMVTNKIYKIYADHEDNPYDGYVVVCPNGDCLIYNVDHRHKYQKILAAALWNKRSE